MFETHNSLVNTLLFALLPALAVLGPAAAAEEAPAPITAESLLEQMVNLERLTEWPEPPYTAAQASSYDRASTVPGQPGWFANIDAGHFVRDEQTSRGLEHVLIDVAGPGALERIWSANPEGTLRFYLDGAEEPTMSWDMRTLMSGAAGAGPIPAPLAHVAAMGYNLYFPIPYGERLKVTCDANPGFGLFYHIGYRTYPAGTPVHTFAPAGERWLSPGLRRATERVAAILADPSHMRAAPEDTLVYRGTMSVRAGGSPVVVSRGQAAMVRELRLRPERTDEARLRGTRLRIDFDGRRRVEAPLGDFFGTGPGFNPYVSLPLEVRDDDWMICRWPMPFRRMMLLTIDRTPPEGSLLELDDKAAAEASAPLGIEYEIHVVPRPWTERTLYFNAHWKADRPDERPGDRGHARDWNFITIEGRGLYVGNVYNIANPFIGWWGEGDERIYIDGADFPQFFGTGSEDYYGYAWCSPEPFTHAYHNQTRRTDPLNYGHASVNRWHVLDAIPFEQALRFDMEQLMPVSAERIVLTDVVNYWYAAPDATHNLPPVEFTAMTVPELPPFVTRELPGEVIEGEAMHVVAAPSGADNQPMLMYSDAGHRWSGPFQKAWFHGEPGQRLELAFDRPAAGRYRIRAWPTGAPDYGIVQLHLNGEPIAQPVDGFHTRVAPLPPEDLGVHELVAGRNTLTVEILGRNEQSRGHVFGLDALTLHPAEGE